MGDELVSRAAHLVGVTVAGEVEGPGQCRTVDRRHRDGSAPVRPRAARRRGIELLDDGEEIGEELSLL